jgi:polyphosphate kinase
MTSSAFDTADVDVDFSDQSLYLNRELSELAYQRRVLSEALDERNPLLERVRFLSIVTRNLDEFVMKRIGGLKQQIQAGITAETADGRTPTEQWQTVYETLGPILTEQAACYTDDLRPALADNGIEIVDFEAVTSDERSQLRAYFETEIRSTVTPLTFDPDHPFPFISNQSLSLGVLLQSTVDAETTFARIKLPPSKPRLVQVGSETRYVLMEDLIRSNVDLVFPEATVVDTALFKVTRNAEVRQNDQLDEDLTTQIEEMLEQRRFAAVARLEIAETAHPHIRELLKEQLALEEREIYDLPGPLDYRGFALVTDLDRPSLRQEPWTPQPHPRIRSNAAGSAQSDETADQSQGVFDGTDETTASRTIFDEIRDDDLLLHHPYHDFDTTVGRFFSEAATDPDVLAVKTAIYRTADNSDVIQSLIDAADNGKQVAVMVELKARFDEQNNLEWIRRLEEKGIHVAYGTIGLKTHTKTALVVREESDGVQLYSHVGTGNYHSETAKGYVDLGLLTADRTIGDDLVTLFNSFLGPGLSEQYEKLLIAPATMRNRFTQYIRREAHHARAGRPARIIIKVNALEDPELIEELYRASMAGVDIELIVRDICRLRPGLTGISETITVHSLVGYFLEHSRIYYFENGGDPEYYLGSADWMTRNLDKRVEAVTPVSDPELCRQLKTNL